MRVNLSKLILLFVTIGFIGNSFADTDFSNSLSLSQNKEGYKLKFIANMTSLPIIDGKWYPEFYSNIMGSKIHPYDGIGKYSLVSIVNSGIVYRLINYKMYEKIPNEFNDSEAQLRLCKLKIGTTKWDCSTIIDTSSNKAFTNYAMLYSSDGDNIAGHYVNSDNQDIVFEYNPSSNKVSHTILPKDSDMSILNNNLFYYHDSIVSKPDISINLKNKTIEKISYLREYVYSKSYSCKYSGDVTFYKQVLQDGNIYTVKNKRLYSVGGSLKDADYFLDRQIGSLFGNSHSLEYMLSNGEVLVSNNNVFVLEAENTIKSSTNPVAHIYTVPTSASKDQEWNALTINFKTKYIGQNAKNYLYLSIVSNQKKLYIAAPITNGSYMMDKNHDGSQYAYLYEISK